MKAFFSGLTRMVTSLPSLTDKSTPYVSLVGSMSESVDVSPKQLAIVPFSLFVSMADPPASPIPLPPASIRSLPSLVVVSQCFQRTRKCDSLHTSDAPSAAMRPKKSRTIKGSGSKSVDSSRIASVSAKNRPSPMIDLPTSCLMRRSLIMVYDHVLHLAWNPTFKFFLPFPSLLYQVLESQRHIPASDIPSRDYVQAGLAHSISFQTRAKCLHDHSFSYSPKC